MKTPEKNLNNKSELQTLENELALTAQEKEDFRKLPKAEQKKRNEDKLEKLTELQDKLNEVMREATETGNSNKLEEAKVIKEQIDRGIKDLEEQVFLQEATSRDLEIFEEVRKGNYDNIKDLSVMIPEIFEKICRKLGVWDFGGNIELYHLTSVEGLILPKEFRGTIWFMEPNIKQGQIESLQQKYPEYKDRIKLTRPLL